MPESKSIKSICYSFSDTWLEKMYYCVHINSIIITLSMFVMNVFPSSNMRTCGHEVMCKQHKLQNGTSHCCKVNQCEPGYFPDICEVDSCNSHAKCRPCPSGTFMPEASDSSLMRHCRKHKSCHWRLRLAVYVPGNIRDY